MWKCLSCGYLHESKSAPNTCPQCGADINRFVLLKELPGRVEEALKLAFAAESKAYVRNLAFARKADEEGYTQVARLFRAVADAERVHAAEYLRFLEGVIGTTEQNLKRAFENELRAKQDYYPELIKLAFDQGREDVAYSFVRSRDVEDRHAALYKETLNALLSDRDITYHVCQVCGYVFEDEPPEECPVCRARRKSFKPIP